MPRLFVLATCVSIAAAASAQSHTGPNADIAPYLHACLSGLMLRDCEAALETAHVARIEGAHDGPTRRAIPLHAPWISLDLITDSTGRIAEMRFEGRQRPGAQRQRLLDFFVHRLASEPYFDAANNVCGASSGGPAWYAGDGTHTHPILQLAVESFSSIRGGAGRPMDRVFVSTVAPAQRVHLCLMNNASPYVDAVIAYIDSPQF